LCVMGDCRHEAWSNLLCRIFELGGVPAFSLKHQQREAKIGGVAHYWQESSRGCGIVFWRGCNMEKRGHVTPNHSSPFLRFCRGIIAESVVKIKRVFS